MTPSELSAHLPNFIKSLSHTIRWEIVNALQISDRRVQEMVQMLDQPMNLVSYHLRLLRNEDLVTSRRSDADGRDMYYQLNAARLQSLYEATGQALNIISPVSERTAPTTSQLNWDPPVRILYLCRANSARSQMAEGLLRDFAGDNVEVYSAGSEPAGVNPLAAKTMAEQGIDISDQHSTHLDVYVGQPFDYVITVCDQVREVCPTFAGAGQMLHWSFPDPLAEDDPTAQETLFRDTARQLATRIRFLINAIHRQHASD